MDCATNYLTAVPLIICPLYKPDVRQVKAVQSSPTLSKMAYARSQLPHLEVPPSHCHAMHTDAEKLLYACMNCTVTSDSLFPWEGGCILGCHRV